MLSNVIRSPEADDISVLVVRTFTELRNILGENKSLKLKLKQLEKEAAEKDEVIRTFSLLLKELNKS